MEGGFFPFFLPLYLSPSPPLSEDEELDEEEGSLDCFLALLLVDLFSLKVHFFIDDASGPSRAS